jgi:zeaxanthin glucosyltransferase
MANIVIAPLYWHANINVTFALARNLRRNGHRVQYACVPETEERIRSQGFDFVPIFADVFPRGTLAAQFANEARGEYLGAAGVNARVQAMCHDSRTGAIAKATRGFQPDLFLVSNHLPWAAIGAWKTGMPVVMFSSVFVSVRDALVPPVSSNMIPSADLFSRMKVGWEWRKMKLKRKVVARISGLAMTSRYLRDLAVATGYPAEDIDFDVLPWPRLALPELLFFPECFDFRRATPIQGLLHVEPSVDTERKDKEFSWEKLDGRPLIYCSLGSLVPFKYLALAKRFFQELLNAMKSRPDLQAVVAIGSHLQPKDFACPPNVLLTDDAPQVALLKRARLMVGHGGGGGIRESIFYGVPMLLAPIGHDAPGNTARAVYHGIALRVDFKNVSEHELTPAIAKLVADPSYTEAARRMSRKFVELQQKPPSLPLIERALTGRLSFHQCA